MLPKCLALLIARDVARDPAGCVTITTVLNELRFPRFPYTLTLGIYVELAGVHGMVPTKLRLTPADLLPSDVAIEIEGMVAASNPLGSCQSTVE